MVFKKLSEGLSCGCAQQQGVSRGVSWTCAYAASVCGGRQIPRNAPRMPGTAAQVSRRVIRLGLVGSVALALRKASAQPRLAWPRTTFCFASTWAAKGVGKVL